MRAGEEDGEVRVVAGEVGDDVTLCRLLDDRAGLIAQPAEHRVASRQHEPSLPAATNCPAGVKQPAKVTITRPLDIVASTRVGQRPVRSRTNSTIPLAIVLELAGSRPATTPIGVLKGGKEHCVRTESSRSLPFGRETMRFESQPVLLQLLAGTRPPALQTIRVPGRLGVSIYVAGSSTKSSSSKSGPTWWVAMNRETREVKERAGKA